MAADAADSWNPDQYARFGAERSQPFYDLLDLVREHPGAGPGRGRGRESSGPRGGRVVDLGCGTGDLTRVLHERLGAAETVGLDSSPAMLARSAAVAGGGLRFEAGDIAAFDPGGRYDLVFSNAALQWVPDHAAILERIAAGLPAWGQVAVQVPANDDHPSHRLAAALAAESPFKERLDGYVRRSHILLPEAYAALLYRLGFAQQLVRLQVYGHRLAGPESVVEWVQGTLLTDYQRRLPAADYGAFLEEYRRRLLPLLGESRPYFYPFKRILFWGCRAPAD
jgi:trans-aconitate 2-methyltransferase